MSRIATTSTDSSIGQKDHSKVQTAIAAWFHTHAHSLGLAVFVEMRIKVSPTRFRIPDLTVTHLPEPDEQVFTTPPYLCIEVLSPADSFPQVQTRLSDYLAFGVENIWIIDPSQKRAWFCQANSVLPTPNETLQTLDGRVALPLSALWP